MEKIIKELKKNQIKVIIIWLIIVLAIFIVGIYQLQQPKIAKEKFNKSRRSEDTVSAEVYYLIGPIAEYKEGSTVKSQYFIGIGDENAYVILTDKNNKTEVPVYGENMTDEEVESLKPITIIGRTERIDTELAKYLVTTYNEMFEEDVMTRQNYTEVFGRYYLDTTTESEDNGFAYALFLMDGIIIIILLIYFSAKNKGNKRIKEKINKYKESGEIEVFNADIENAKTKINKKLKVLITNKYIYNFNEDLEVIPIEEISNAYTCCIVNGEISKFDYIAIETKDNTIYFIAAKDRDRKNKNFDRALNEIKQKIR